MSVNIVPDTFAFPDWLARMFPQGYRRFRCNLGDYYMHYMEWGDPDGFPVLLQHGNPTWGFLYRNIVTHLLQEGPSGLRLIVPDLIGLGFSSKPLRPQVHTLANHSRWLGLLLDELKLSQLLLVCQDWGGPISCLALSQRPNLLKGLVVLNTILTPPEPNFHPTRFHRFANKPLQSTIAFRLLGYPQRNLSIAQGDKESISGEVARAYRYPLRGLVNNTAPLALARMVPSSLQHPSVPLMEKCRDYLANFKGPVSIVWGEKDPVLGRSLDKMIKLFPDADVARTGGGHFIQEEFDRLIAHRILAVYQKLL